MGRKHPQGPFRITHFRKTHTADGYGHGVQVRDRFDNLLLPEVSKDGYGDMAPEKEIFDRLREEAFARAVTLVCGLVAHEEWHRPQG